MRAILNMTSAGYALDFSVMHDVGTFFVEANDGAWAIENL